MSGYATYRDAAAAMFQHEHEGARKALNASSSWGLLPGYDGVIAEAPSPVFGKVSDIVDPAKRRAEIDRMLEEFLQDGTKSAHRQIRREADRVAGNIPLTPTRTTRAVEENPPRVFKAGAVPLRALRRSGW